MATRPKIIKVSHILERPSQHKISSKKKKKNVIHIAVGLPQNTGSILSKYSTSQMSVDKPTKIIDLAVCQTAWEHRDLHINSIDRERCMNSDQESGHKKNLPIQENEIDGTQDHHRQKKKSKKCRYIFISVCLLATLLIVAAVATTLGILLSQKSTTEIPTNASLRWNSSGITILGTAGVIGQNASLLSFPYGIAFDSSNTLYIADYNNNRIQKLLTGTSLAVTVAGNANGTSGAAMNQLSLPVDILFDSNNNMYITDRGNNRVQFWANGATSGTKVAGNNGTLNISFNGPSAILSDPYSNTIFITDTYNNRIISYPTGTVVAGGNGPGNNNTQLYFPFGLVYDSVSQSFVIPNDATNNIVRWVLGATSRTLVAGSMAGTSGSNSTLLNGPVGITMDPMGNIYVADSNNHRIQLFMVGQSNATTIIGTGVAGTNATQLHTPYWVILDNQLNLYVSDTSNNRIQKYLRY